jgi:hypothetical protein
MVLHSLQDIAQSGEITLNEADVTSTNPPIPLLCGCIKKKKKEGYYICVYKEHEYIKL